MLPFKLRSGDFSDLQLVQWNTKVGVTGHLETNASTKKQQCDGTTMAEWMEVYAVNGKQSAKRL